MTDKNALIVVTVESIQNEPYISPHGGLAKSATLKAVSSNRELIFDLQTGLLNPEQIRRCELLLRHGFTVVELPQNVPLWRDGIGGWKDKVIVNAMERIAQTYADGEEIESMEEYDEAFADEVLVEINKHFPHPVQTHEIKFALKPEPSDSVLLTALAGLQRYGYIDGKTLFNNTGQRRLAAMANIEITAEGRTHLPGQSHAPGGAVIHGDQINNYGNAGAIGRHSVGTINQQYRWAAIENQVDLSQVALELQTLRGELMKTAKTPADFQRLTLVAEAEQYAEKNDGPKVMEALLRSGKWLFDFATQVGTDITAKLLAKAIGLEP